MKNPTTKNQKWMPSLDPTFKDAAAEAEAEAVDVEDVATTAATTKGKGNTTATTAATTKGKGNTTTAADNPEPPNPHPAVTKGKTRGHQDLSAPTARGTDTLKRIAGPRFGVPPNEETTPTMATRRR
jgi:hypothetical protein